MKIHQIPYQNAPAAQNLSAAKNEFIRTERLRTHFPTAAEIQHTIAIIQERLASQSSNSSYAAGYREALRILTTHSNSYEAISQVLESDAAKAIAVKAVDYLNGECSQKVLIGIPLMQD